MAVQYGGLCVFPVSRLNAVGLQTCGRIKVGISHPYPKEVTKANLGDIISDKLVVL